MLHSETLRLEMAPFGVKVVSVVTGAVATNIMTNTSPNYQPPPDSLFKRAFKEINERATGEDVKSKMDPTEFASKVVRDILGGASGPGEELWHQLFVLCRLYASLGDG